MEPPARLNFLILTADDNNRCPGPGRALPLRRTAEDIKKHAMGLYKRSEMDSESSDSDAVARPPPLAFRCKSTTCLPQQYVASTLRIAQQLDQARRRDNALRRIGIWRRECERLVRVARARRKAVVSNEFDKAVKLWCNTHSGDIADSDLDWTTSRLFRLFCFLHPEASIMGGRNAVIKAVQKCRAMEGAEPGVDTVVTPATLLDLSDGDYGW